jgi:hypothetical protein
MRRRGLAVLTLLLVALGLSAARAAGRDEGWVRRRVQAVKGSDTTAWRKIPWAASLGEARRASRRERQPLFLFTHDGNIDTGRC